MPTDFAALLRAEKGQQQDATRQPAPQTDWAALLRAEKGRQQVDTQPAQPPSLHQAAQQVTDEMGGGERFLVGVGRGLMETWRGAEQLALQAGSALGVPGADENLSALHAQEADERALFDAGVGQTTAGKIGSFAGEVVPYFALPGGAVARGASLGQTIAAGARLGGLAGGLQYVDDGESRISNAVTGAAMGGLAGGLVRAASSGGTRLANAAMGRMRPEAQAVESLGKQFGVPILAPDAAQSPMLAKAATIAEDIPFSGIAKARIQQSKAAEDAAESLAGRLAPQIDDVGREIQGSLTRRTEALQKAAGVRYDRVAKAADPLGPVPLTNLRATAKQLLDDAKQDIDPNAGLIARLENIANANTAPNFSKARQYRSGIGDEIRKLETSMDLKAARPLQQLKGALEQDMNQFANNAGGEVSARWKSADRFFRERVVPQRESDIARAMRNKNPDEVFKQFIRSSGQDRAQRLYNALDGKGRDAVKAGILQQALDKATLEGSKGVAFSPAKFAQELERVQGGVGVFFRGADRREIDGFTKLMRHVERAGQVAENPPTGNRLVLPFILGDTLALGGGMTAGAAGSSLLTRALFTTQAGKRLLLAADRFSTGSPKLDRAIALFRQQTPALVGSQADETRRMVVGGR